MDMPPSRYRVIERDRRLIVLDSHAGDAPVVRAPPLRPAEMPRRERLEPQRTSTAQQASEDLGKAMDAIRAGKADPVFETQRWYDDKAPRRVRMRQGAGGGIGFGVIAFFFVAMIALVSFGWPVLVVGAFLLFQPGTRKAFRHSVTKWLDRQEQV